MNKWSERTLRIVMEQNYLDKLQKVYPHEDGERDVEQNILDAIRQSFKKKDEKALLNQLLSLEKFPYKDSYRRFSTERQNIYREKSENRTENLR